LALINPIFTVKEPEVPMAGNMHLKAGIQLEKEKDNAGGEGCSRSTVHGRGKRGVQ